MTVAALGGGAGASDAQAVSFIRSDLDFVLNQIKISENHAAGGELQGNGPNQVSNPLFPYGVRTVDGSLNNLIPGQSLFGAAGTVFPRLLTPTFRNADPLPFDPDGPGPLNVGDPTDYNQTSGLVIDSSPRRASNLIVDQTADNPVAAAAAADTPGSVIVDDGDPTNDPDPFFIPNRAPDEGLSAPFNNWFIFFGQFFDHGLDLVSKGKSGTVIMPLDPDDPLFNPATPNLNFMVLTRATNQPGPDGIAGDDPSTPAVDESADDVHEHVNGTTPHVDQNQTYTSHPSHQVFLREYELNADGKPVATGRLLESPDGGLARWQDVKAQASAMLGIELDDQDGLNVPLLVTDPYGKFVPDPTTGFAQIVTAAGPPPTVDSGTPAAPVDASAAVRATPVAFLVDIAHDAVPFGNHDGNPSTPDQALTPDADTVAGTPDGDPATYDDELFDAHFIAGDGRGNENVGLTSVHQIFHSEHNRLVDHVKSVVTATGDPAFIAEWQLEPGVWNGERVFQAARFATEMQYQHLVFEEFARKVQPNVNVFNGYATDIDPTIVAEFAHTVYRFGHSMLTENVRRTNADGTPNDLALLDAFLNPLVWKDGAGAGTLTPEQAAGAVVRGTTRDPGNEIDELVTDALRNSLLGLPLDLASINLARGRDTGVPSLNAARRQFYADTAHSALKPYTSWTDFGLGIKHPEALVNFIAAYGAHPTVTGATTLADKRAAATDLVIAGPGSPADRLDFLNSDNAWANGPGGVTTTGLDDVDFWVGGLAERTAPFGGMLGSTFNFVFENQMERLQDGDRFYYLSRTAGLNFLTQLEENSFASLVMRNTDTKHLPADVFSRPDFIIERDDPSTWSGAFLQNGTLRFEGGEHVVMGGTPGADSMRAGDGDDTLWGDEGNDELEGAIGNDSILGGPGADILTDSFGEDNLNGGPGNDALHGGGGGPDLLLAGFGKDFVIHGEDETESFGGVGDDFIQGGPAADIVFGNEGADWIEGGGQADLLQGGNQTPFEDDTSTGDDVLIGGSGNDDYDSEGGDDIQVSGPGVERFEGMLGFDWVTSWSDPQAQNLDMNRRVFAPPDEDNVRDRFDLVEGLSGWRENDILRGETRAVNVPGNELTNPGLIDGLQDILGAGVTEFSNGNIMLGGEGSDLIEGRGGNDLIDGDAWLNVRLSVRDASDPTVEIDSASRMSEIQQKIFDGTYDPGQIRIVREIRTDAPANTEVDTAEFSGPLADYTITQADGDPNTTIVDHTGGAQTDGTDTIRNTERLKFADQTIVIAGDNAVATGTVNISDTTPTQGQTLTATAVDLADANGLNLTTLQFSWQAENRPGEWVTIATGATFTPGNNEEGLRLRAIATFEDGLGVLESINSAPTDPVENVNDPATGVPVINDTTPQEGQAIAAITTGIADLDGMTTSQFAFQWQQGNGGSFADIGGATNRGFTPGAAQVGQQLRVVVSFTDDGGFNEQAISAPSAQVTPAPPPPPPPPAPPAPLAAPGAPGGATATSLSLGSLQVTRLGGNSARSAPGPIAVSFRLSSPATVRLTVRRSNGGNVVRRIVRKAKAGKTTVRWNLRDGRGRRVKAGRYRLVLIASNGTGARRTRSRLVRVTNSVGVTFRMAKPSRVRMRVLAPNGRIVRQIVRRVRPGKTTLRWNLRNSKRRYVAAGRYRIVIHATRAGKTKRVASQVIRMS